MTILLFVLLAAQAHPCDTTYPTAYREPASQVGKLRIGFCFIPQDVNGAPLTEPIGFNLQINGGADIDLGILTPLGTANAAGLFYYEAMTPALAGGMLTLTAYAAELGTSAKSAPIQLTLLGPPKAPTKTSVQR